MAYIMLMRVHLQAWATLHNYMFSYKSSSAYDSCLQKATQQHLKFLKYVNTYIHPISCFFLVNLNIHPISYPCCIARNPTPQAIYFLYRCSVVKKLYVCYWLAVFILCKKHVVISMEQTLSTHTNCPFLPPCSVPIESIQPCRLACPHPLTVQSNGLMDLKSDLGIVFCDFVFQFFLKRNIENILLD